MNKALDDITAERQRQIRLGWTAQHDDAEHDRGDLAAAAASYVLAVADVLSPFSQGDGCFSVRPPDTWPWDPAFWKPGEPRRMLVKAAALLIAEIERIDRQHDGRRS